MSLHLVDTQVVGGTLNVGSTALEVETTALAKDSAVARMAELVEQVVLRFRCGPYCTYLRLSDKSCFTCTSLARHA